MLSRCAYLRVLAIFLAVVVIFSSIFCPAAYSKDKEKVCLVEAIDYPGKDPTMWYGLYAAKNGIVYSALITEGGSAHIYKYDPKTREHKMICDLADFLGERGQGVRPSSKIHCKPVEDDQGNIYFATLNNGSGPVSFDYSGWRGGHWIKYDPKADKFEDLGLIAVGDGPYAITIDKKRMRLFGTGFKSSLYRLDMKTGRTIDLGRVSGNDICRSIFCDDKGNAYGSFPGARLWKYDAEKEKVIDLSIQMPFDPTIFPSRLNNPIIDRTQEWRAIEWDEVEKVAYGITCGSGSILFKYDPDDGPEGKFTELTKLCDRKYLGRKDVPYSTLSLGLDTKNRKVYYAPSARPYTLDEYIETFGSDQPHHLLIYDMKTGEVTDLGAMRTTKGERVFGCEGASVGPDGTLYLCGQVECLNVKDATRHTRITDVPISLRLIIYRP
jgi:hypothetical protein